MQQHDCKYFTCRTPPTSWVRSKFNFFQNMIMLHISQMKSKMQQNGSKCFVCRPPPPWTWPSPSTNGVGSKGQNSSFTEHGHVLYQVKLNHECRNIMANILPADAPTNAPDLLGESKGQKSTFRICHVAYQIKCDREYSNMQANILSLSTPLFDPLGWAKGQNNSF